MEKPTHEIKTGFFENSLDNQNLPIDNLWRLKYRSTNLNQTSQTNQVASLEMERILGDYFKRALQMLNYAQDASIDTSRSCKLQIYG